MAQQEASVAEINVEDINKRIEHEIQVRDDALKLVSEAKLDDQILDAAKILFVSNQKIMSYMSEIQKRRNFDAFNKPPADTLMSPCKAQISVSKIRIPLLWKENDLLNRKIDARNYAIFCLLRIDNNILDSVLVRDVNSSTMDITFDNIFYLDNVGAEFECKLEVYCQKQFGYFLSSPKRIRKKVSDLSSSISKSFGKKISKIKTESELMRNIGPKFDKIAEGFLVLDDISGSIDTFNFSNSSLHSSSDKDLQLFGNFCCKFVVRPYCWDRQMFSDYLFVQSAEHDSKDYYCHIKDFTFSCWVDEEQFEQGEALFVIPITKLSKISQISHESNPHCIQISNSSYRGQISYKVTAISEQQFKIIWSSLQQILIDQTMWKKAFDVKLDIPQNISNTTLDFLSVTTDLYSSFETSSCDIESFGISERSFEFVEKNAEFDKENCDIDERSSDALDGISSDRDDYIVDSSCENDISDANSPVQDDNSMVIDESVSKYDPCDISDPIHNDDTAVVIDCFSHDGKSSPCEFLAYDVNTFSDETDVIKINSPVSHDCVHVKEIDIDNIEIFTSYNESPLI